MSPCPLNSSQTITDWPGTTTELLKKLEKRIIPTNRDGHCLLHATLISAENLQNRFKSLEELKKLIRNEISTNQNLYNQFLTTETLTTQVSKYLDYKEFNIDVCDLIPIVIANILKTPIYIIEHSEQTKGSQLIQVSPNQCKSGDKLKKSQIYLYKTLDHYEGLAPEHSGQSNNS